MLPQQRPQGPSFTPARPWQDLHPLWDLSQGPLLASSHWLRSRSRARRSGKGLVDSNWSIFVSIHWSLGPSGKAGDVKRGGDICGGLWESGRLWDFLGS